MNVRRMVAAFVVGLAIMAGGGLLIMHGMGIVNGSEAKCGSRVMQEGDVCQTISDNGITERQSTNQSRDHQKTLNDREGILFAGFGAVVCLLGLGCWSLPLFAERREARARRAAQARPGAQAHAQPGR
ncbi:hypothetical protein [Actinomadura xylanilytica]|uniref:hypothetical protein n=1 Tax=Actinomadura xylanilytica TaxID=887459 RepID=UPI00255B1EAE|nr:hypothetical protein [Actinomadura xylanilytica]MDL4776027.1 hypothetical protein [Actinomadura xylanilytica]